jgi:hypothetical protein
MKWKVGRDPQGWCSPHCVSFLENGENPEDIIGFDFVISWRPTIVSVICLN